MREPHASRRDSWRAYDFRRALSDIASTRQTMPAGRAPAFRLSLTSDASLVASRHTYMKLKKPITADALSKYAQGREKLAGAARSSTPRHQCAIKMRAELAFRRCRRRGKAKWQNEGRIDESRVRRFLSRPRRSEIQPIPAADINNCRARPPSFSAISCQPLVYGGLFHLLHAPRRRDILPASAPKLLSSTRGSTIRHLHSYR